MENERKFLLCPKCGSEIEITENQTLGHCTFCDSLTPLPFFITNRESLDAETYKNMLNRVNKANAFSLNYQYHRAFNLYDKLIKNYYNLDIEDYYPYFGKVLAQYGVSYSLNDKLENELICLKIVKESIYENENYLRSIELADTNTEAVLKQVASLIDQFQKEVKKELITINPTDVCILVDNSENNPNAKVDLALAERIKEKLEIETYSSYVTKDIIGTINKEFVINIYKQLLTANHLVVVSSDPNYLNDSIFRHIWMNFYTDSEISETIVKRMSVITNDVRIKDTLPISNIEYFDTMNLDGHLEFLINCLKEIEEIDKEHFKNDSNQNPELVALIKDKEYDQVKDVLNLKLKVASLDYNEWWLMFLAKHRISSLDDIEDKAINLAESYYFQKAYIGSPRYVKRYLYHYYIKCKEALDKLSLIDEEYDKEVETYQKTLYKKEISALGLYIIPVIISTLISYWTLSISNLAQLIIVLIINAAAYLFFLKKMLNVLSIGKVSRNITSEEEKFNYLQQLKKALTPSQAAKFIPTKKSKQIHKVSFIMLGVCLMMTLSFFVKEIVVKAKNHNLSYYYIFDSVVITSGKGEEIIIPNIIDGKEVVRIKDNAFKNDEQIVTLIVSNGIKEIGSYAFTNCQNLKNVTIPASVEKIGESPFIGSNEIEVFLYQGKNFKPADFLGKNYQKENPFIQFITNK